VSPLLEILSPLHSFNPITEPFSLSESAFKKIKKENNNIERLYAFAPTYIIFILFFLDFFFINTLLCKSQWQVLVSDLYHFSFAVEGMRKESRIFNSSRYLAILLYVYQGQMLSHPTGQWFRRQLCRLLSWITRETVPS
jgi:hypothetical protein